jgi:Ca2+-dependent lipid-binding protein
MGTRRANSGRLNEWRLRVATQVWSARNPRNKFSTKVVKKNTNPVWHSKVFTFPRGESKLCLEVMDKDFYRTDCMGVAEVSLKDLQPGKPQAIWLPLEVKKALSPYHTKPAH